MGAFAALGYRAAMNLLLFPVAAIGYSLIYLLFGGGIVGAVVIYFFAKMFGK